MTGIVISLLIIPVVAAAIALWRPRSGGPVTAVAGIASFALVLALIPLGSRPGRGWLGVLRIDALSVVFLLATGFLYGCVAVYSIGYLRPAGGGHPDLAYARRFWAGLNLFAWSMLAAPMMGNLALLWIAIEVTTIVSALLVALEGTAGAAEAAWKYVLLASAGLAIALLGTIFAYYAGAHALGPSYNLAFGPLLQAAGRLPHAAVQLAFVLAVLGFGTKAGLFPVHTWLPDAHSEAPTPVSALLSGSLLAVSFYAILRYYQVALAALGPGFPRDVLLVFGVASLLLAALYLLDQRDYKRLLAYSSVEHMGILAIGVSFGVPIALAGVLLHVLAHAAAKGNAFMGAGVLVRKFGSKRISAVTGGLDLLPWSGPLLLAGILALSALPPFGLFRSEFEIVAGGLAAADHAAAAILVVLVTVAFLGLSLAASRMLLTPPRRARGGVYDDADAGPGGSPNTGPPGGADAGPPGGPDAGSAGGALRRGEPSGWMVAPMLAGLAALLLLGLHPPGELTALLDRAVAVLGRPGMKRPAAAEAGPITMAASVPALWDEIGREIAAGRRFAGLMGTQHPAGLVLSAHLAGPGQIAVHEAVVPSGAGSYPALTPRLGAASWYEREIQDLFGVPPAGHPRPEPLILPRRDARPPRPGSPGPAPAPVWPAEHAVPRQVLGPGLFTIAHGPVRSGVLESVEYLVETPGEDIPRVNPRVFYKHRGIEKRFEQEQAADGVLLAERTEGVASVAHALAYCHAAENLSGAEVPRAAALVRVVLAELERLSAHLWTATRLADAAGLAVATANFGGHAERISRLVSGLCGSRFGRGVVIPGGVRAWPDLPTGAFLTELSRLDRSVSADAAALMGTASFLDRLRATGPLRPDQATAHGALGPVGKASGLDDDARWARPYDGYRWLTGGRLPGYRDGDALARLLVRWDEVRQSFALLRQAASQLGEAADGPLRVPCGIPDGRAVGWAEAPQGEVIYDLTVHDGRITRCRPRSASRHNLALFPEVFAGDILTDFPFIEASFGLSVAGVAL